MREVRCGQVPSDSISMPMASTSTVNRSLHSSNCKDRRGAELSLPCQQTNNAHGCSAGRDCCVGCKGQLYKHILCHVELPELTAVGLFLVISMR